MIHLRLNNLNFPAENETQNHRKSRIQRFERSELRLHFEWPKLKKTKNGQFGEFLKINSVTRQVSFNRTKIPQFKNSNARFWVIFKQYENIP